MQTSAMKAGFQIAECSLRRIANLHQIGRAFFCLRIANPQERLTDLRISLTPSGLANQYYWTYTTAPSALLGPCVELTCESSVVYNL